LFAENRPDVNLMANVEYKQTKERPVAGRIGVGTWNTAAEFKELRVEHEGKLLYDADFTKGAAGWTPESGRRNAGTWVVEDGVYRQKDSVVAWSYFGKEDWNDVTVTLKARKLNGAEGFLVSAGYADGRRVQFNVGGWGNTQHAIQVGDAITGGAVRGSVEEGRWYDIKIEVKNRRVRAYLDGQLIKEVSLAR